jgi:hypothetical protein
LLAVEALGVAALVVRAGYIANAVAGLSTALTFATKRTLRAAAVNVGFRVVQLAVLAGTDVASAANTNIGRATIRVLQTFSA